MKVEIYSDVVCPWCYIGKRRFDRALARFPGAEEIEVVFRPYQLDPEAPESAEPLARYLERRFGRSSAQMRARVGEAAASEGITIDWDRALAVNTRTAHRLLRLALREYGPDAQRRLADGLFDAHFSRGIDIASHEALTALATAAGLDERRVRAYLASGEGAAEVAEEIESARVLGVRAVPAFVFDGEYLVEGGQPSAVFVQVLDEVRQRQGAAAG